MKLQAVLTVCIRPSAGAAVTDNKQEFVMPRYSRAFFLCLPLLALAACEPSVEAPAGAVRPAAPVTTQTLAPPLLVKRCATAVYFPSRTLG